MRLMVPVLAMACLSAGGPPPPPADPPDAATILAAAREALGGEARLAAVKSFVATGRTRQVRGDNLVPIEFEIACELPDKYVRKDEVPAQETGASSAGFNGDRLIQVPPPDGAPPKPGAPGAPAPVRAAPAPAPASPSAATPAAPQAPVAARGTPPAAGAPSAGPPAAPPDPRKVRVDSLKQDFARLFLGMFAASPDAFPVAFVQIGRAEAPQGKADILEVKGPGTFLAKLFVNSDTHLPIMLSWMVPATNAIVLVPGQPAPENPPPGAIVVQAPAPPSAGAPKAEQEQYAKDVQDLRRKALAGKMVEQRLYYADYRDVGNGIRFPFRLRRATAGETVEETNFDGFQINRRIDARRFEPLK
jgi:hypothetical protein